MRTFLSALLLLICVALVVLAVTNPQMYDFQDFVEAQSEDLIQRRTGESALGNALAGAGSGIAATYVNRFADRTDYIVCSVYTIDPDGEENNAAEWRFLGIADRFIVLEDSNEKGAGR